MRRPRRSQALQETPTLLRQRSFAHVHWFRRAKNCPRCRKIEGTFARYGALNDTLAVVACVALGCGCGDPKCQTVVNAVLAANGSLPVPAPPPHGVSGLAPESGSRAG